MMFLLCERSQGQESVAPEPVNAGVLVRSRALPARRSGERADRLAERRGRVRRDADGARLDPRRPRLRRFSACSG